MASRRETLKLVREMLQEENGEPIDDAVADVWLDRSCEAFYHKVTGAGYEYAVQADPVVAKYLMWVWTGDDGRKLRAAIKEAGI